MPLVSHVGTDGTARCRRVRDEAFGRSALDAAREVREQPRHPQELELEAEADRLMGCSRTRPQRCLVERVEKAGQREEGLVVSLLLWKEPQHGLDPDHADLKPP